MRTKVILAAIVMVSMVAANHAVAPGVLAQEGNRISGRVGEVLNLDLQLAIGTTVERPGTYVKAVRVENPSVVGYEISIDLQTVNLSCKNEGSSVIVVELASGGTASYLLECKASFGTFAPPPGGGAGEPHRFITGNGTWVTKVECNNPLSCAIANQGSIGGFTAACVARGPGKGTYQYAIQGLPSIIVVRVNGVLTAVCPPE